MRNAMRTLKASCLFLILIALVTTCQRRSPSAEFAGPIRVGHLVGICMSPLFLAHAKGYFKDEGLDVELVFVPAPGDSITALTGGAVQFIHNPFTNTYMAVSQGAPLKIIAGSGNGGLFCIAQPGSGIKNLTDLKNRANTGLRVGTGRIDTLELTFYRTIKNQGLNYADFNMVWFNDPFAMMSAFQQKQVDVVTHVEPYATMLIDKYGGVPLSNSFDVWGVDSPDCVVSVREDFLRQYPITAKKYIRALLRADAFIKAHQAEAVEILNSGRYYKVDKETLAAAIPRQPPGVDLRNGVKGMDTAINDMVSLGYLKSKPANVVDLSLLEEVIRDVKYTPRQ
jgi:NitT/TauT family transport system substrate-binding protein